MRAAQSHSMTNVEDERLLESLIELSLLPRVCVHGTNTSNVSSILKRSLLACGLCGASRRKHVHFAPLEPGDHRVISGIRAGCDAAIYIDFRAALRDGVPLFRSTNNVMLSPGIEGVIAAKYIMKVRSKIPPPPQLPSTPSTRSKARRRPTLL